jgi:hypothetical protein
MDTDAFDASSMRLMETDTMAARHPATGQPTTWIWTLAGLSHKQTLKMNEEEARETQTESRERARVLRSGGTPTEPTQEEQTRRFARRLAARVVDWTPVTIDGGPYPCTRENVMRLFLDPAWDRVYRQVIDFLGADTSFTHRSESSR